MYLSIYLFICVSVRMHVYAVLFVCVCICVYVSFLYEREYELCSFNTFPFLYFLENILNPLLNAN